MSAIQAARPKPALSVATFVGLDDKLRNELVNGRGPPVTSLGPANCDQPPGRPWVRSTQYETPE